MGMVYYLTTTLTFPQDREQWVKQDPIAGATDTSIGMFIDSLSLSEIHKQDLRTKRRAEWKDHNGVWIQIAIENTIRNKRWATSLRRKSR